MFRSKPAEQDRTRALLDLLYHVSREVATALDLRTVLQRVLYEAIRNVGGERASIVVLDDNGNPLDATIVYGQQFHEHTTQQLRETVERGLAGWVVRNRKPALIPNTAHDERWLRRPDDSLDKTGAKSAICVPLLARERLVGVLTLVHSIPDAFNEEHLELMQAIADLAGVAVLNAQYYDRIETAHQRYRELFEDSIDPILITDWTGRILEVNRQAILLSGYSSEELHSKTIEQLHEINAARLGIGWDALANGDPCSYESRLRQKDDLARPVEVHVRRVEFEEATAVQWMFRDIQERKELDALREDLTAMIYHDLRSPLGNVVSSLEVLSEMVDANDESVRSILSIASNSTARIQRLLSSLLDLNRLEAGQPVVDQKMTDPASLIGQAVKDTSPAAEGRRQTLLNSVPSRLPPLWVDPDMARRVLTNLIENAIKFTPAEGKIELGAKVEGEWLELWVKDNGPGIPPADQKRVFEKFTRLRGKDKPAGLGVGLAFCRLAVLGHGGRIWVNSQAGEGTEFRFTLPLATQQQIAAQENK